MSQADERELVLRCLEDDRQAQEALYRRYADAMFSVCLYYAKDREEACDFLQEGFIRVFKRLDRFRFEGSLEGWIRRIIVTSALDQLRKKKRYTQVLKESYEESFEQDVEEESYSVPSNEVIRLVNELPQKCGLVMKLYAIEGYTHLEIAEIMGITVGTSKSQLNRARQLLRKSFARINA